MNGFQLLFRSCCYCRRRKRIAHLNFDDPTTSFIYSGIDAFKISRSSRQTFIIADFGSSYGQNSIQTMKSIIEYLRKTNTFLGIPLIIHNDIPTNNWSRFFQFLIDDNSYYGLATGRSFYEQCLPTNSLSIGFSSASLHYLSKTPCHLTNHCYFQFSTSIERELFRNQSKLDWNTFLQYRSQELIPGGILILSIPCVDENGQLPFDSYFDLIYQCAQSLSILTSEELLHFTLPFYLRSLSECVDLELFYRFSLELIQVEFICLKSLIFNQYRKGDITKDQFAKSLTMLMRPGIEFALKQVLQNNGRSNQEIDHISTQFWCLYEKKIKELKTYATYLILKKK
ncbi:hypothetical protein I4U23_020168 [Adineta vaga]|nr:hypothetical protein I4U23_020168 [Adineta vaga]